MGDLRLTFLGAALALLASRPAGAESSATDAQKRAGGVLGVGGGLFILQSGASDREDWTAVGPRAVGQLGWGITSELRLSLEAFYARATAVGVHVVDGVDSSGVIFSESYELLIIEGFGTGVAADWVHSSGFRVGLVQGAGFLASTRGRDELAVEGLVRGGYETLITSHPARGSISVGFEIAAGLSGFRPQFYAGGVVAWM